METFNVKDIKITDTFFARYQKLIRDVVLPYQWEILNDRVDGASPSYCMHNFKAAAALNARKLSLGAEFKEPVYTYRGFEALPEDPLNPKDDEFYGFVFQDSDFSKWIEAVAYTLATHPNPELEQIADGAIDIVCAAQLDNGYLDTYYIINGMDRSFTDLRDHHELYCLGHLIEGAIAYSNATGKDKLLNAASRFADYVASKFGPEDGKIHGYPGHEIAEMALFELYEKTGNATYKTLAEYFINERGREPNIFEKEHPDMKGKPDYYHQAHKPVRDQDEAVGHAVRAVYLYSGMADMARITGDKTLTVACEKLWNSIVNEKMYITGGIGATHIGEAFSFPYDLPNDTVYAETCASIGLVFFARRMLQLKADRRYSDVMELAIYNGILSGIALDGKSFFYVNPLEVDPVACHKDERKYHIKPVRQKWFGCACCPPNLARLISSIGSYAYTKSDDTLFVHLYMSSSLSMNGWNIEVSGDLPNSGLVSIKADPSNSAPLKLALRIPSWCSDNYKLTGAAISEIRDGYMYIELTSACEFTIDFDLKPRFVAASSKVSEDLGKVALVRGPIVYAMESVDNGPSLKSLGVAHGSTITESVTDEFGAPEVVLNVSGFRVTTDGGNSYCSDLYRDVTSITSEAVQIRFIPYRLWANRGENEMSVFVNLL